MSFQAQSYQFIGVPFPQRNMIQLKNQSLQPETLKITIHESVVIRVSHNNSFGFSQIENFQKKYIFAIEQLDQESIPLAQDEEYEFGFNVFDKVGQFKILCINMPKVQARIIVQKGSSESADELNDQTMQSININQSELLKKTPIKLPQVKEEQPQEQNIKQFRQEAVGLSNSNSDFGEYERILTEEEDSSQDTLQNKYLKYFKEEFKLWRNFFQEQELNEKKLSLKSKHTKNLSLSEVKEIDPKHKSQYDSDHDSPSQNNSSSVGKGVASQLFSHQEILDRNNQDDIHSTKKQMKKTNSEYGFNLGRSKENEPTIDKISVFGKDQEQINLVQAHSRRSNHQSSKAIPVSEKKKSRISMSRTQTNSPALKQYKKENNFMTWTIEWAKEKDYKNVTVNKKNDHHLIKQFDTYMKNKFKVTDFLYC